MIVMAQMLLAMRVEQIHSLVGRIHGNVNRIVNTLEYVALHPANIAKVMMIVLTIAVAAIVEPAHSIFGEFVMEVRMVCHVRTVQFVVVVFVSN